MNFGFGTVQSTRGVGRCGCETLASATCSLQLAKASAATLSKNKASAATLSQQKENDSADVQRGGVNIYPAFSVQRLAQFCLRGFSPDG